MQTENKNPFYAVPGAIIVAGLVIAGAIYLKDRPLPANPSPAAVGGADLNPFGNVRPVSAADHIRGNPEAPVKIVEYSDLECPFCKSFHQTMKQVLEAYPGQVAWVYRHFPLDSIHSKARREAEAAECVGELAGPPGSQASNDKFFEYIDKIFEITPSNDGLDLALLPELAAAAGITRTSFEECLTSGRHQARVQADLDNALASGGQGTPFSVIIAADGRMIQVPGALPFQSLKEGLDQLLVTQ